jgi:hypothetical protein
MEGARRYNRLQWKQSIKEKNFSWLVRISAPIWRTEQKCKAGIASPPSPLAENQISRRGGSFQKCPHTLPKYLPLADSLPSPPSQVAAQSPLPLVSLRPSPPLPVDALPAAPSGLGSTPPLLGELPYLAPSGLLRETFWSSLLFVLGCRALRPRAAESKSRVLLG